MKACLVLLLAVAANAQFYNGFYNYPYTATAGVYNNFGYGIASPYSTIHSYGKREAEAEPQFYGMHHAMPYYQHSAYAAYKPVTYVQPQPMHYKTYSNDAVKPMGYAAKGRYVAQTAGSVHVAKREAEAEPTHTIGYNTYQTSPLSYVSKPIVAASAYNNAAFSIYRDTAFPSSMYPYMHSYGKREAEAEPEADPALIYGSGVQYPMTYGAYNNFGYNGIYNQYSTAFPYMHSYGKREAEAEPQYYGSFYGNRAFTYGGIQTPYQTYNTYNSYPSRYYY